MNALILNKASKNCTIIDNKIKRDIVKTTLTHNDG